MPTLRKNRQQPVLAGFDDPIEPAVQSELLESAAAELMPPPPEKECGDPGDATDLAGKTVYVVDSHSLIYQVFHAMPEMTGPSGQPVGAVQGFIRDVVDLIENHHADYLICTFDEGEVTFRNEI